MLPTTKTKKITDFSKMNTLVYGLPKVGKSTFCSQIPDALFLTTEQGFNHLEIYNVSITKWEDVLTVGAELVGLKTKNPDVELPYKTLVIDIADWFFKHCENYVMKANQVVHPSDLGFGKGYALVKDEFVRVVNRLNQVGVGMVFVSHAKEREQSTKTAKWTYMDSSLPGTASGVITGLCDFILFFHTDSEGKRFIRTKATRHINAGDRSGKLPELIPLDYNEFKKAFDVAMAADKIPVNNK